nr:hypothetical protein [uncultured Catonella sp.]
MNGIKTTGKITGLQLDYKTKKPIVSIELDVNPDDIEKFFDLKLDIRLEKEKNRRSLDANAMLWACLSDIAKVSGMTNWEVYLYELERYGKFTHILVKREALNDIKKLWRETKEVGERGNMVELLCFFGSSTYTASEFSKLLEGVISDMKDWGLVPPPSEDMRRTIESLEKKEQRKQQEA